MLGPIPKIMKFFRFIGWNKIEQIEIVSITSLFAKDFTIILKQYLCQIHYSNQFHSVCQLFKVSQ